MNIDDFLNEELIKEMFKSNKIILENILKDDKLNFQGYSLYLYTLRTNGTLDNVYKIGLSENVDDFIKILENALSKVDENCEFKEYKELLQPNGIDKISYMRGSCIPLYKQIINCIDENKFKKVYSKDRDLVYKKSKGYIVSIDYNDLGMNISNKEILNKRLLYFGNIKKSYLLKENKISCYFSSDNSCILKKVNHNVINFIPYIGMYAMYCEDIEDYIVYICDGNKFEGLLKYDDEIKKIADEIFDVINSTKMIKNIDIMEKNLNKKRIMKLLYTLKKESISEITFEDFKKIKDSIKEKDKKSKIKFDLDEKDRKIIIDEENPIESIRCIIYIYKDRLASTLLRKEIVYAE